MDNVIRGIRFLGVLTGSIFAFPFIGALVVYYADQDLEPEYLKWERFNLWKGAIGMISVGVVCIVSLVGIDLITGRLLVSISRMELVNKGHLEEYVAKVRGFRKASRIINEG